MQASSATESLGDGDDTEKSAMIVKKIFELVKENKAITREELASQVFLSPDYMAKVFKKETGKRISDYLSEVRLQEAKCLLTDTTRSISDIASSLSYSNFSGFSRMFKSETGFLRRSTAKSTAKHSDFSVYHTFYNLFRQAASSLPSSAYKSMAITQRITIDISTQSSLNTWEP